MVDHDNSVLEDMENPRKSWYHRIRRSFRLRKSAKKSVVQYALDRLQPSTIAKSTVIPLLVFTTTVSSALL